MKKFIFLVMLSGMGVSVFGQSFSRPAVQARTYTAAQKDSIRNHIQLIMRERTGHTRTASAFKGALPVADTAGLSSAVFGESETGIAPSVIKMHAWEPSEQVKEAHGQSDFENAKMFPQTGIAVRSTVRTSDSAVSGAIQASFGGMNISVSDSCGKRLRQSGESAPGKRWSRH